MRAALVMGLALSVLSAGPPAAAATPTDWPLARADVQATGTVRLSTSSPTGPSSWRFRAGSHVWGYRPGMSVWSSAAVGRVDGRAVVVVGSYDRNIYCLDARSGERIWRYTTGGGVYSPPVLWHVPTSPASAPTSAPATPVVDDTAAPPSEVDAALPETLVLAGSSDRQVYALDARSGARVWTHAIETWRPTIGGAQLSAPAVGRAGQALTHAVFVGHWVWDKSLGGHLQAGGLSALEARSGRPLWTTALGDNQLSAPLYVEIPRVGPRVFVASENGNLYAVDPRTGEVVWTRVAHNAIKSSPTFFQAAGGPRVLIGSKHGRLRCHDAVSGTTVWSFRSGHWIDGGAAVEQVRGRQVVFVGSYDTTLYALEAETGRQLWAHQTGGGIYSSPAVLREPDGAVQVIFASWDHHLHCVSGEDGRLLWSSYTGRPLWDSITLGDSVWSSPSIAVIDGHGVVFFGSYAGPLYAIPLAQAARAALAGPSSNLRFWVTMPLVLLGVGGLAIYLSRRQARKGVIRS